MNVIYVAVLGVVLGVVLLLASYLIGGSYTIVPVSNANAVGTFVMNRYTGNVWLCDVNACRVIPDQQPAAN